MKSLLILSIALVTVGCATAPMHATTATPNHANTPAVHDPAKTDKLIAFHEERVKNDPKGALGLAMLSEVYLAKSRERDDDDAALKAEDAARRSLAVRKTNNSRAAIALTHALLEQHRFEDALVAANEATALEAGNVAAERQIAEILLELGRYDEFKKKIAKLNLTADPSGEVIMARWLELQGENKDAEQLLLNAAKESEQAAASAPDTTAWFYTKLGEAQFRFGKVNEARESLGKALELDPTSYKAAAAMTRLEAGFGNWSEVIKWGEKTGETAKMTDIQGLVADGYRETGKKDVAEKLYKEIEAANATPDMLAQKPGHHHHSHDNKAATKRHTHDRLFSLFLADRSRYPFLAHHAAEEDLSNRKDIYSWDTFAWGTFQYYVNVPASVTGEGDFLLTESQQAIDKALATGVKDPRVLYHAGMIYRKNNPAKATAFLKEALAINPHFNAIQAQEARKALAAMEGSK